MKIVCDSCGAKYSIADEKVAGKVFKIRCKKCSAVIVVRGDQVAAEEEQATTNAFDYGGDAVWHVVVDGDQQGPFAPAQIGEMLSAGTIDWEVYVWREGFDGWLAARDVPELVEAVTGQPAQQQAQPEGAGAGAGYGAAAMGADPFGGQQQPQQDAGYGGDQAYGADQGYGGGYDQQGYGAQGGEAGGLFGGGGGGFGDVASRATHDAGADLFAQSDAAQSPFGGDAGGDDDVVASQPSPRVSHDQASMTGQRNENSVLFSLSNLQALATGSGGSPAAAPSPVASAPRAGHASGEGSGLIDIRALAGATGAPSMGGGREERANADDLLSIGTGGGLGGSLGAPVLSPVQEERSNKGLLIGAVAAAGVLAAALVVVVVVLVTKEPEPVAQASGAPNATGAGAVVPGASGTTPSGTAPSGSDQAAQQAAGDEGSTGAEDEGDEGSAEEDEGSRGSSTRVRRGSRPRRGGGGGGSSASSGGSSPSAAAGGGSSAPARSGGGSDIDSLLDQALGPMGGGGARATPMASSGGGASRPEQPPRDSVASGLRSVAGAVAACGQGQHGVANTTVTISGSTGRVSNAQVTGQFAGTPIGSCVARAVRGARFPRFSRPTFQVSFPYRL